MPEDTPVVSVVVGAYNAASWIEATLRSVLNQTFSDLEVIVVDDASTDATPSIVRQFGTPVRLVERDENGGSAAARNRGIREARGAYVAFLDADDLWQPEKLERQMQRFDREPGLMWGYTDAVFFDSDTGDAIWQAGAQYPLPEGEVLRPLLVRNFIPFSSVVVRREALEQVGGFDTAPLHRISEDWDLWLRLAERYPIGVVRAALTRMRQHAAQKTETMDLDHALRSRLRIAERAVERNPEQLGDVYGQSVANLCFSVGRQWLMQEEHAQARRVFWHGIRHHPAAPWLWIYWMATFLPTSMRKVLGWIRSQFRALGEPVDA